MFLYDNTKYNVFMDTRKYYGFYFVINLIICSIIWQQLLYCSPFCFSHFLSNKIILLTIRYFLLYSLLLNWQMSVHEFKLHCF